MAITDPGTSLERMAREKRFRRVFPGQPDIGGRYSALSNFGMVPVALAGVDIRMLLSRAEEMAGACAPDIPLDRNPAVALGVLLAEAARGGRDKLTFVMSPGINTFADWVEQLLAESTGKEGKGLVPVVREYIHTPESYGNDRVFIYMTLTSELNRTVQKRLEILEAAGHPVVRFELTDPYDLGKEFFRWEVATATAGALLGINPFDQPNVQESKDNTNRLLGQYRAQGDSQKTRPSPNPRASRSLALRHSSPGSWKTPGARRHDGRGACGSVSRRGKARKLCGADGLSRVFKPPQAAIQVLALRSAMDFAWPQPWGLARGFCTRPANCTRAGRTTASSF